MWYFIKKRNEKKNDKSTNFLTKINKKNAKKVYANIK